MKPPFVWDPHSDQPYPLNDKAYKQKMRKKVWLDMLKMGLEALAVLPAALIAMPFFKGKAQAATEDEGGSSFYGMGVDIDKGEIQKDLIEELGVKHLLIRMPLWEMHRIEEYVAFAKSFGEDKEILLNILQDREHIEDSALLTKDIETIFEKFGSFVTEYQIGNAINRTKWGFFSMDEYLAWYESIQQIRDAKYPHLKLIGSSVIDFEYHYTVRTLFNFFRVCYDSFSALLYVDRRGAPQNRQYGLFDTNRKIDLLYALIKLSPKSANSLYITEVNWPLSGTAPYAPTSEKECVSESAYASYMRDYHAIARDSGKVDRIYWHQLIAPGYGLVDNRGSKIRKMPAFEIYKRMVKQ